MKKLLLSAVLLAVMTTLASYSSGPGSSFGDLTTSGCSCHGPNSSSTSISVQLLDSATGLPTPGGTWTAGGKYTLNISGDNTSAGLTHFGFQVVAVTGSGASAGTLSVRTPATTQTFTAGTVSGIEHSTQIARSSGLFAAATGWTAPAAGTGTVTFRVVLNAVNNNGGTSGDVPNIGSFTAAEGTALSIKNHTPSLPPAATEASAETAPRIFPVPATDRIGIQLSGTLPDAAQVMIVSAGGQVVRSLAQASVSREGIAWMDVSALPPGTYMAIVHYAHRTRAARFTVAR